MALNLSAKLDLYSLLDRTPGGGMTWPEIAKALSLKNHPSFRGVQDWLDLLVSIDTLTREGNGAAAR